jgi:hypothetical protein
MGKHTLRKYAWIKYILVGMLIAGTFIIGRTTPASGEEADPRFVLMRLEDIGPGGQYDSLEQLGKLRAVLDFMSEHHVPVHLAVIPRWLNVEKDGSKYDQSLDHVDNPYIHAFNFVLHEAENKGASIGMHGYTHQYGDVRRADNFQESGIGNEFNVEGAPESTTAEFAGNRIQDGVRIMQKAGFTPRFWEAPHYHTTPEQDELFRSYFGLNYQADVQSAPTSGAKYKNNRNTRNGAASLGSVYIPTPFSYIPYNKDERMILDKLGKSKNIASFFYHPFLEFKYLNPVIENNGMPALRDGIPVYSYEHNSKSVLHKLVASLEAKHYQFYSIHDYVPFTPSVSMPLLKKRAPNKQPQSSNEKVQPEPSVQIGDVTGDGQADLVTWQADDGTLQVTPGAFQGLRNAAQSSPQQWQQLPYSKGSAFALGDANSDGKQDLWVASPNGKLTRYDSSGSGFALKQSWSFPKESLEELYAFKQGQDWIIAGQSLDHTRLVGVCLHDGVAKPIKAYPFKSGALKPITVRGNQSLFYSKPGGSGGLQFTVDTAAGQWKAAKVQFDIPLQPGVLRFGDFNGDGKEDLLRWDSEQLLYTVYLAAEDQVYNLLSTFGPWGQSTAELQIHDLDGNGKSDLALIDNQGKILDTALSFEVHK